MITYDSDEKNSGNDIGEALTVLLIVKLLIVNLTIN